MMSTTGGHKLIRKRYNETNYCIGSCSHLFLAFATTILFVAWCKTVLGFTPCHNNHVVVDNILQYRKIITQTSLLFAGKKGSNSNTKSNSRQSSVIKGGFGRVITPKNNIGIEGSDDSDDYKVFPALEARVRDTLIPAPATLTASTVQMESGMDHATQGASLSSEIYQRLDQIYGFPLFNYENRKALSSASENKENGALLPSQRSPLDLLMNIDSTDDEDHVESIDTLVVDSLPLHEIPPFSKIRVLHIDPMVLSIDDFFTSEECEQYIQQSETNSRGTNGGDGASRTVMQSRSPTVGKDSAAKSQRTSTTFYHNYDVVPELMSKASRLLGLSTIHQWEEPQTVRYRKNEKFTWHLDALGPIEQQSSSSGQRTATLLVYLTDLNQTDGGATLFRDLGDTTADPHDKYLRVQPKKGMALLFFPSAGGITDCPFDIRTLHCGEVISNDAICDKWIAQLWLRQRSYQPTAPPGNRHNDAYPAIAKYCKQYRTNN